MHSVDAMGKNVCGFLALLGFVVLILAWRKRRRKCKIAPSKLRQTLQVTPVTATILRDSLLHEKDSLCKLRTELDGVREELLCREEAAEKREALALSAAHTAQSEAQTSKTLAAERLQRLESMEARGKLLQSELESAREALTQEQGEVRAAKALAALRLQDFERMKSLRQGLQAELEDARKTLAEEICQRQQALENVRRAEANMTATRGQAASQGEAFTQLAARNAALEHELKQIKVKERGFATVQAELDAGAARLEVQKAELEEQKRTLEAKAQAMKDQALRQAEEHFRLLDQNKQDREKLQALEAEHEAVLALQETLRARSLQLDERESLVGRQENQMRKCGQSLGFCTAEDGKKDSSLHASSRDVIKKDNSLRALSRDVTMVQRRSATYCASGDVKDESVLHEANREFSLVQRRSATKGCNGLEPVR